MPDDIGDRFWRETKHHRDRMERGDLDWSSRPETYKQYPQAEKVPLPSPSGFGKVTLDECLAKRRSVRAYSNETITAQELSNLLWAVAGINRRERGLELRNVPSAGALYPIETYLGINRVDEVRPGIYHHQIRSHSLEMIRPGPSGKGIANAAMDQGMLEDCAASFIWTAMVERDRWKYGQRSYRYINLDVGHIAQNLALACAAMGLGCCHVAAFYDDEVNSLLGVDGLEETVVYMSAVGRLR